SAGGNLNTDADITGNRRLYGSAIDMGAYEWQPAPSPITGLKLTAKVQGNNTVLLTWTTIKETNTKNFITQRSADNGKTWINIDTQPTKAPGGTSAVLLTYTYTDIDVPSGNYVYQIIEEDLDGTAQVSNAVQVQTSSSNAKGIFPNPATSVINVTLPAGSSNVPYRLICIDGKIILQGTMTGQGNYGQIPVSNVLPGIYFLQIFINNTTQTYKVLIWH
ncbi:MAG: T9SS type A sorting domain-containing protein, partial [Chitinophagaceae bacterium]|nr:T9SS type A sorting domain-containing protein [Chitinophagaceae bacterium]